MRYAFVLAPIISIILINKPVLCKKVSKEIKLSQLADQPQIIFLTKFDIGVGQGYISVKTRKKFVKDKEKFDQFSLNLGIISDQKYEESRKYYTCADKTQLFNEIQPIVFYTSLNAKNNFTIKQQNRQRIWYVYIFDCEQGKQKKGLDAPLLIDFSMKNNGSQFGEDQNYMLGYVIICLAWLVTMLRFIWPIIRSTQNNDNKTKLMVYIGFIMLGLGYFYRFLNLIVAYYGSEELLFLEILYLIIKNIVEGILVTVIVSIAWGWSITHLRHDPTYILIGTVITLINIVCLILDGSAEQIEDAHHQYDGMSGIILFILRTVILGLFIVGIFRSMAGSVGKSRHFLKKFGIRGTIYLAAWPIAVLIAQLFLPNYMHQQIIILTQQGMHLLANAMLCHLFAFPNSDYQKVDKGQQFVLTP